MPTMTGTITGTTQNKSHVFLEDVDIGEYGEFLAKKYLGKIKGVTAIEDKSNDSNYQKADIDILTSIDGRKGKVQAFEIKNDTSLFPNLFFETKSVVKENKVQSPGCMIVSEANYLMYIYQTYGVAIFVPLPHLVKWVEKELVSGRRFKKGYPKNKDYKGEGYRVPVRELAPENGGIKHLQFVDIHTGKRLNHKEFERRRKNAIKKLGGSMYAKLKVEDNWREENEKLFPNKNNLHISLLSDSTRRRTTRRKLEYLEGFYGETIEWLY